MQVGISPKVWAPVAAQIVAFLVNLIASGEFDRTELAQLVGVVLTALIGYFATPGEVVEKVGPASDDLLGDVKGQLGQVSSAVLLVLIVVLVAVALSWGLHSPLWLLLLLVLVVLLFL